MVSAASISISHQTPRKLNSHSVDPAFHKTGSPLKITRQTVAFAQAIFD